MQVLSQKVLFTDDPISARERILEQRDLWRCESEHYEQNTNQADYGEGKPWVLALQPIPPECPPLKEKDQQCGDVKDGDVDPV